MTSTKRLGILPLPICSPFVLNWSCQAIPLLPYVLTPAFWANPPSVRNFIYGWARWAKKFPGVSDGRAAPLPSSGGH